MNWVTLTYEPWMPIGADKAKQDFAAIAEKHAYHPLIIDRASQTVDLNLIQKNDLLIHQYPSYLGDAWELDFLQNVQRIGARFGLMIHDFEPLRILDQRSNTAAWQLLAAADFLVVHNSAMAAVMLKANSTVFQLGLFDYLTDTNSSTSRLPETLAYAGSLTKASWLKDYSLNLPLEVFGRVPRKWSLANKDQVNFHEALGPEIIAQSLESHWGLVWDTNTKKAGYQNYEKINSPHKLSLYLAADIPVIVWQQAAIAEIVLQNHIGITIDNLHDISEQIKNAEIDFHKLKHFSNKIRSGYFTTTVLEKIDKLA